MYKDMDTTKQGIGYKPRIIGPNQWAIAILLFMAVAFSGAVSIIYSSSLPFFLTLAALLLIPCALIVISTITPSMLLGIHISSRLILDSFPGIMYKDIIGSFSIMKFYSTGVIVFGLVYLFYKREVKLDWLSVLLLVILSTRFATTIYHQNWVDFLADMLKWIYLWLIINLTRLAINKGNLKRFAVIILLCHFYPIVNFFYSVVIGQAKCAGGICRFIGTYSHQSDFSFIMMTIIPSALYLMIIEKEIIKKLLYTAMLLLAHVGIYSASLRTAWVMLVVYWAIFFWLFQRLIHFHKKVLIIFVITIIVIIGFILTLNSPVGAIVGERLAPLAALFQDPYRYLDMSSSEAYRTITGHPYVTETEENSMLSGRIGIWKALILAYRDAPLEETILGLGVGMDREIMAGYKWGRTFDAHNIYIETLVETGILGFLALLTLFATICFKLSFKIKNQSWPISIAAPVFLSYMVAGLAGNTLDDMRLLLCVGLYLGIALYYQELQGTFKNSLLNVK